jgi:PelA/Pel-15E family pectate lyase
MDRRRFFALCIIVLFFDANGFSSGSPEINLRRQAATAMRKAVAFYRESVASNGGYVYYYSVDLKQRWGEGVATPSQIWVQPPGTPTVGMAYLKAYEATGDRYYLNAAQEAAEALVYGQLKSGGWTNVIDFNRRGRVAQYRNGKGGGKNNSSFDDGQSQSAIRLLIHVDKALRFRNEAIHEAAEYALDALLGAQFPNGAFPQVWTGPVKPQPIVKADYPDYDWRKEGRIKNYWDKYTLNDNVCGYIAEILFDACNIYNDERFMTALKRLGDFLIMAQMPNPQPAWAQQYNYEMKPIWARKFEPPAISGGESQQVIETLMEIYRITKDKRCLEPIPRALSYLERSLLADGRIARYYELRTNRPLYMFRRGDVYTLTYDDSKLPKHYSWKIDSQLGEIEEQYNKLKSNVGTVEERKSATNLERQVRKVIRSLDGQRRWISIYRGEQLVGQPKFELNSPYISSAVFSTNIELLSEYLTAAKKPEMRG